ncbi:fumarate reductase subunit D [Suttonella sp. R2A3]|uniref:fumarate reductase subunit FrdD n=1 Tax=Suttonella sp. R2A3 TaxID=2908648 RepID=UPI001F25DDDC|nr:fumarate reductase subunit FrdD [Suttonella sp. R2A3]UJF25216.1 fumarate reductase subunit D [Suttonella sp. R2A3]
MSHKHLKPLYWGLFSVGGTTAALFLAPIVLVLCILLPLGVLGDPQTFYENAHPWLSNWFIFLIAAGLIFTFLWHGMHRFYYILHDLHIHVGNKTRLTFYAIAIIALLITLGIGWFG